MSVVARVDPFKKQKDSSISLLSFDKVLNKSPRVEVSVRKSEDLSDVLSTTPPVQHKILTKDPEKTFAMTTI